MTSKSHFTTRMIFVSVSLVMAVLLYFPARAQYVGGPISIVSDFSYSSSVTVTDTNPVILVLVTLFGLTHGRSGDLHAIISHRTPDNITTDVDLFSRPGVSFSSIYGAVSSTSGDYAFSDGPANTFSAAAIAAGTGMVPNGLYHPSTSDGVTGSPVLTYFRLFKGQIAAGTWNVNLSDGAMAMTARSTAGSLIW